MTTQMIDMHSILRAANDNFESAFAQGDSARLANFYTDNAMLLPTEADFVKGKKAIGDFWQGAMDMGVKGIKLEILEIEQHGDSAIDIGQYTLSGEDGLILDKGKYLVVWKNEGGSWKLDRDMWNSSSKPT
jgi:ketosteroid isomerase-like protein